MHSNTMQEQAQFRVLTEIKTCESACYGLQGLQMAWCSHCISGVNSSKDLPWYLRQAPCKSCSIYATSELKNRWKEKPSLVVASWPPIPTIDPTQLGTGWIAQSSLRKQALGETAHTWMWFPWDRTSAGALNLAQPSRETQTFSLLTRSGLIQQTEAMVTLLFRLLALPWSLSVNHA